MIAVLALRAAELARLRTDFASSVTHELRTPLTQIRLAAETLLLGRTRDRESERRALTSVVDETGRLQQLIDNVLHFSRAERRLTKVVTQRLELRPFVEGIAAAFAPLVADHRMTIRPAVPDGLFVQADPDLVHQVLLNLLDNAARYGPDDQTIDITAKVVGPYIEIAVNDEGPGIPPADRQRVWRPFVRLEQSGGPVTGTGLGLAVARDLVEAQGGRCRIEGRGGPGASVIVSFPIGASI
jgi:signal transduction histidine kinase